MWWDIVGLGYRVSLDIASLMPVHTKLKKLEQISRFVLKLVLLAR